MTPQLFEQQLVAEGFTDVGVWHDGPDVMYPHHAHPVETAHIILSGSMVIEDERGERVLSAGDRYDIPANMRHAAHMGPSGCTYVVGERAMVSV